MVFPVVDTPYWVYIEFAIDWNVLRSFIETEKPPSLTFAAVANTM
jgi:hypothetical protein